MAKRKNGGGDGKRQAKTIETGGIKSSPLFYRVIEAGSQKVEVPIKDRLEYDLKKSLRSVPMESPMPMRMMEKSTPLQSRSVFDEDAPIDFSTLPSKNTFLDQIRDTIKNNPK